jgi:RHH-type proline utilization regulon transcriptional repressor/proline dehydrogenase/delta 1-pyrroline-5-carboxylate dehydrogenase
VGEHRDLLAYLVRRLLENGANSSFVHQLADDGVRCRRAAGLAAVRRSGAFAAAAGGAVRRRRGATRRRRPGLPPQRRCWRRCRCRAREPWRWPTPAEVGGHGSACTRRSALVAQPLAERAAVLRRAADALDARLPEFCGLLVQGGHKTWATAWPRCARRSTSALLRRPGRAAPGRPALPGPTGESNLLRLHGRGVFVCISPWNFPLAIFAGQVVAALVAGNTVAAKPAEQTPAVAQRFVALLHEAGVPVDALQLLHGLGETVGAQLVADAHRRRVLHRQHRGGAS